MSDWDFLSSITDFGDMIQNDLILDSCSPEVKRVLRNLYSDYAEIQNEAKRRIDEIEEQWAADGTD